MVRHNGDFGTELRRRRMAAGVSLGEFARMTHYDKGYLSKVERGHRQPGWQLAARCDAALDAAGALIKLAPRPSGAVTTDGPVEATPPGGPTGPVVDPTMPVVDPTMPVVDVAQLDAEGSHFEQLMKSIFLSLRRLGQASPPATVLPTVMAQIAALLDESRWAGSSSAVLTALAAREAEFAGWMAQEQNDAGAAVWWTDTARSLAASVGYHGLVAMCLVRRAEIALSQHEIGDAIEYAGLARDHASAPTRVRGMAAHRQAQAHASIGDASNCIAALHDAEDLLAGTETTSPGLVLGTSTVEDQCGATAGWCYVDLGRPAEAVEHLAPAVARIPVTSRRARGLFGARLSLAYAACGERDLACAHGREAMDHLTHTASTVIRRELRNLSDYLRRWPKYEPAQQLDLELTTVFRRPSRASSGMAAVGLPGPRVPR